MLVYAFAPAILASAALTTGACLDATPITVAPKDSGLIADASCSACIRQPPDQHGCGDLIDRCHADPNCGPLFDCVDALSCFDRPSMDEKITCAAPCVLDAGITTVDDPRVTVLFDLVKCGETQCSVACNLGDAALGFDGL